MFHFLSDLRDNYGASAVFMYVFPHLALVALFIALIWHNV